MKKIILLAVGMLCAFGMSYAGDTLHVLFIGNSYTAVNDLPHTVQQMATAGGHTMVVSASDPGGMTLQGHLNTPSTTGLIAHGGWDYVVLQGQSQIPSFPENQVQTMFYPYAKSLDSLIHAYNPCAKTVFYMTWGRKNGDPQNCPNFPPLCTYDGMDSLLRLRYTNIADSVSAYISPAGPVWHYLRNHNPAIELYQSDNSHPTVAGTFAVANSFYTLFYGENPMNNTFTDGLNASVATAIKTAAKQVVFDSLNYWKRFAPPLPVAGFSHQTQLLTVTFSNESLHANHWLWNFGDGQTDTSENPTHTFTPGTYTTCLKAIQGCDTDVICDTITLSTTGISGVATKPTFRIYPNPVTGQQLQLHPAIRQNSVYRIVNIVGQQVQDGTLSSGQNQIKLNALPGGVYVLQIWNKNGFIGTVKFQKE